MKKGQGVAIAAASIGGLGVLALLLISAKTPQTKAEKAIDEPEKKVIRWEAKHAAVQTKSLTLAEIFTFLAEVWQFMATPSGEISRDQFEKIEKDLEQLEEEARLRLPETVESAP